MSPKGSNLSNISCSFVSNCTFLINSVLEAAMAWSFCDIRIFIFWGKVKKILGGCEGRANVFVYAKKHSHQNEFE